MSFQTPGFQANSFQTAIPTYIARLGDLVNHANAPIIFVNPSRKTTCGGIFVATVDDLVATHFVSPPHPQPTNKITTGANKTTVSGRKLARVGDLVSCGATITTPVGARVTTIPL